MLKGQEPRICLAFKYSYEIRASEAGKLQRTLENVRVSSSPPRIYKEGLTERAIILCKLNKKFVFLKEPFYLTNQ